MSRKPRILLIPNVAWWIVGEMGKRIMARFGDKYEFYFLPETLLGRRPELLYAVVPAVDAIHCLNESSIGLLRIFKQAALPPLATWIHHVTRWSPDHQMALDWSTALTVCTGGWKTYVEQRLVRPTPVTVVAHGVDTEFFRKTPPDPLRFGVPPGRFVVGFVGSKGSDFDDGRKGIDAFLKVVRRAASSIPNLHVLLGGPGWERESQWLRNSGISVTSTGFLRRADLPPLYSAMDVFLLTSRVEGGPCTVLEAMACETVVVATRVGTVPDTIVDGVNGFSTDVDDCDALLLAILQLQQNPWKRQQVAKNARHSIAGRSWDSTLSPLETVYDDLVRRRQLMGLPQPGPAWMKHPHKLLRASCAADALAHVLPRVRAGALSTGQGFAQLRELLDGQPALDLTRGAAMLAGATFRAPSTQPFHGWIAAKPVQPVRLGKPAGAGAGTQQPAEPANNARTETLRRTEGSKLP